MAFVSEPVYTVTYTFADETGNKATTTAYIDQGLLFVDVLARAGALGALLNTATNGAMTGYTVSRSWVETNPGIAAGSRVERKGRLIFVSETGTTTRMDIPAIRNSIVLSDGALDRSATSPIRLIESLILVDFLGSFTDYRGADLTAISAAYEAYKGTSKARLPKRRIAS